MNRRVIMLNTERVDRARFLLEDIKKHATDALEGFRDPAVVVDHSSCIELAAVELMNILEKGPV